MKIKLIDYIAGYAYQHWGVRVTDKDANIKWGGLARVPQGYLSGMG